MLANDIRPKSLSNFFGQDHLLDKNKPIYRIIKSKTPISMILYGPPACGKTTLANILANELELPIYFFNATINSKDDLKKITKEKFPLLLVVDEIQSLTKPNQNFLLSYMESGDIIVIGCTTENPYMSVAPAIRSRCQIYELYPLTPVQIQNIIKINTDIEITDHALELISMYSNGDARLALNILEIANKSKTSDNITKEDINDLLNKNIIDGDQSGDSHYNLLSALQKSIRGSDTDAALHYAARLLKIGDLKSLIRRLTVIAYEDIGLADSQTVLEVTTALNSIEKIGLPEARIIISYIVIKLALAEKSNTAYKAIDSALTALEVGYDISIPRHLRDGHYKGSQNLGNAIGYLYPHDYPNHYIPQQYLPDSIIEHQYLDIDNMTSQNEFKLKNYYKRLKDLQNEVII